MKSTWWYQVIMDEFTVQCEPYTMPFSQQTPQEMWQFVLPIHYAYIYIYVYFKLNVCT